MDDWSGNKRQELFYDSLRRTPSLSALVQDVVLPDDGDFGHTRRLVQNLNLLPNLREVDWLSWSPEIASIMPPELLERPSLSYLKLGTQGARPGQQAGVLASVAEGTRASPRLALGDGDGAPLLSVRAGCRVDAELACCPPSSSRPLARPTRPDPPLAPHRPTTRPGHRRTMTDATPGPRRRRAHALVRQPPDHCPWACPG